MVQAHTLNDRTTVAGQKTPVCSGLLIAGQSIHLVVFIALPVDKCAILNLLMHRAWGSQQERQLLQAPVTCEGDMPRSCCTW